MDLRILFLNVQSPPLHRAILLAERFRSLGLDVLVLSELSSAEGSSKLVAYLESQRYTVYWIRPARYDYAVAIAIKGRAHKAVKWPVSDDASRYQVLRIKINSIEIALIGTYFPSLNRSNLERRVRQIPIIEKFLSLAGAQKDRCVLFGGDINAIPSWHKPTIPSYTSEGFLLHKAVMKAGLVDLAEIHLPDNAYSWFDRYGAGQLLDSAFVSSKYRHAVAEYSLCDLFRIDKLSDHSGLLVGLDLCRSEHLG